MNRCSPTRALSVSLCLGLLLPVLIPNSVAPAFGAELQAYVTQPQHGPLVVTSASLDSATSTLIVSVVNQGSQPLTAVTFSLLTTYSDATTTRSSQQFDYYLSLAFAPQPVPRGQGVIAPTESRTFELSLPVKPSVGIADASVEVLAVVMLDTTAVGDAEAVERILAPRRQHRDSLEVRLAQLDEVAKGRTARRALEAMLEALDAEANEKALDSVGADLRMNLRRVLAPSRDGPDASAIMLRTMRDLMRRQYDIAGRHSQANRV